jgi:hypothetical protein
MKKSIKNLETKKIKNLNAIKGGKNNPLHQAAQVVIQVDLGELEDVDFE